MLPMLALGALSFGGSLLQGMGAKQASAKQGRMQMIADALARQENERILAEVNAKREQLGQEMLNTPEQRGVDAEGFMAAAERMGINPVTYLNAGGLSSHGWVIGHNAEAAYKLMAPEYQLSQASQIPQQHSMLSAIGAGLSSAGTAMGTQYRADMSYDLQMNNMNMSMDKFMMGLSNSNGLQTALSYGMSGGGNASRGTGQQAGVSSLPYPTKWEQGKVEVTNPHQNWQVDKTQADAEAYETRYGDIAQEVFGAYNLLADSVKQWTGKTIAEHGTATRGWVTNWWNNGPAASKRAVTPYAPFAGAYPSWASP